MTKTLNEQQIRKIIENVTGKAAKVCEQKFYDKPKSLTEQYQRLVSNSDESVQKMHILEKKLSIATKALKNYADEGNWDDIRSYNFSIDDTYFVEKAEFREKGYEPAKKALKEMEGVK